MKTVTNSYSLVYKKEAPDRIQLDNDREAIVYALRNRNKGLIGIYQATEDNGVYEYDILIKLF